MITFTTFDGFDVYIEEMGHDMYRVTYGSTQTVMRSGNVFPHLARNGWFPKSGKVGPFKMHITVTLEDDYHVDLDIVELFDWSRMGPPKRVSVPNDDACIAYAKEALIEARHIIVKLDRGGIWYV